MDLSCKMLGMWRHCTASPARSTSAWHRGLRRYRSLLTSCRASTFHLASLNGGDSWKETSFSSVGMISRLICLESAQTMKLTIPSSPNSIEMGGSISPSRENHMQASFPKSRLQPISKRLSLHASFNEVTATTMQLSERILSSRTESMSVINDGQL